MNISVESNVTVLTCIAVAPIIQLHCSEDLYHGLASRKYVHVEICLTFEKTSTDIATCFNNNIDVIGREGRTIQDLSI